MAACNGGKGCDAPWATFKTALLDEYNELNKGLRLEEFPSPPLDIAEVGDGEDSSQDRQLALVVSQSCVYTKICKRPSVIRLSVLGKCTLFTEICPRPHLTCIHVLG